MKIRLMGLPSELNVAVDALKLSAQQAGYYIQVSNFYPCRGSDDIKRVYIDMYSPMTKQPLLKDGERL